MDDGEVPRQFPSTYVHRQPSTYDSGSRFSHLALAPVLTRASGRIPGYCDADDDGSADPGFDEWPAGHHSPFSFWIRQGKGSAWMVRMAHPGGRGYDPRSRGCYSLSHVRCREPIFVSSRREKRRVEDVCRKRSGVRSNRKWFGGKFARWRVVHRPFVSAQGTTPLCISALTLLD